MKFTVRRKIPDLAKDMAYVRFVKGSGVRLIEREKGLELALGIDESGKITRRKFITLVRKIIQTAKQNKIKRVAVKFDDLFFPKFKDASKREISSILAQNMEMANFELTKFKEKPKEGWDEVKEVFIYGGVSNEVRSGFEEGFIIGEEVNRCRTLANTPGGDMTPKMLAEAAKKAASGTEVEGSLNDVQTQVLEATRALFPDAK